MKLTALPPIYQYQDENGRIWTVERFYLEDMKVFWTAELKPLKALGIEKYFRAKSKKEVIKMIRDSYAQ